MSSEHEDDEFVSETVEAARRHYLDDFPNPERIGCPSPESLRRVAGSSELPDRALREHLVTCSPCFREFQELREAMSRPAPAFARVQRVGFRSIISPYYLVAALALVFLGCALVMLGYCDSHAILAIDDTNSNKAMVPASTNRLTISANTLFPSLPERAAPARGKPPSVKKGHWQSTPPRRGGRAT